MASPQNGHGCLVRFRDKKKLTHPTKTNHKTHSCTSAVCLFLKSPDPLWPLVGRFRACHVWQTGFLHSQRIYNWHCQRVRPTGFNERIPVLYKHYMLQYVAHIFTSTSPLSLGHFTSCSIFKITARMCHSCRQLQAAVALHLTTAAWHHSTRS